MRKLAEQQNYDNGLEEVNRCLQEDFYHELKTRELEYLDLIRDLHDENKKLKKKLEQKENQIQSITNTRSQSYPMWIDKGTIQTLRKDLGLPPSRKLFSTPENSIGIKTPNENENSFSIENISTEAVKVITKQQVYPKEMQENNLPTVKSEELFKNILRKNKSKKEFQSPCKSIELKNGEVYDGKEKNEWRQKAKNIKMIDPEKNNPTQRKTPDISICEIIPEVSNQAQPESFSLFRSDYQDKNHSPKLSNMSAYKQNYANGFILTSSSKSEEKGILSPRLKQRKQPRIMNKIYL